MEVAEFRVGSMQFHGAIVNMCECVPLHGCVRKRPVCVCRLYNRIKLPYVKKNSRKLQVVSRRHHYKHPLSPLYVFCKPLAPITRHFFTYRPSFARESCGIFSSFSIQPEGAFWRIWMSATTSSSACLADSHAGCGLISCCLCSFSPSLFLHSPL